MRISDWSSDVCSSDLPHLQHRLRARLLAQRGTQFPAGSRGASAGQRRALPVRADVNAAHLAAAQSGGGRAAGRALRLAAGQLSPAHARRSEEHTSELQSLMRISYAVFCLKKKNTK